VRSSLVLLGVKSFGTALGLAGLALEPVGLLGGGHTGLFGCLHGVLGLGVSTRLDIVSGLAFALGLGGRTGLRLLAVALDLLLALLSRDLIAQLIALALHLGLALAVGGFLLADLRLLGLTASLELGLRLGLLEPTLTGQVILVGDGANRLLGAAHHFADHSSGRALILGH
jgi:hypothetical protein